jgi:hypothetical protein
MLMVYLKMLIEWTKETNLFHIICPSLKPYFNLF